MTSLAVDRDMAAGVTRPILEMDAAELALSDHDSQTVQIDFVLRSSELVIVQPGEEQIEQATINAVCGLIPPRSGAVRFLGLDWSKVPPDQANAMRGRIGHVFRKGEWVPHLTLADNILLGQLYHTRRSYADARDEAARLAVLFGLPGLPIGMPYDVSDLDRCRAAYIRAFLGEPDLIILESPMQDLVVDIIEPLLNAIRQSRARNAAVLWFMLDRRFWSEPSLQATQRIRLHGTTFESVGMVT